MFRSICGVGREEVLRRAAGGEIEDDGRGKKSGTIQRK